MVDNWAPPDLHARAHENYLELFRALARIVPDGAIHEEDGVLMARTGPLLPMCNAVILSRTPADMPALLARARDFFAPAVAVWALTTRGADTDTVRTAAFAAGLSPDPSPEMVLEPIARADARAPAGTLRIEPVRDRAALRIYNDTMTAGFGGEWAHPDILSRPALLNVPGMTHYVGWLDRAPVATAMLLSSHRIAGIFNVSTIPAFRRRGIGTEMTWRAALDGRAEGCTAAALQATEMGLPVYQRMGFRQVTTYTVWLPADEEA